MIRLILECPIVAVIMGLWLVLLSEKPSSISRVVGQQIGRRFSSFSSSTVTLYLVSVCVRVCVLRGECSKNYQEIRRGAELILLLLTGGGARRNNFPFEAHFSAPPPDNYCKVPKIAAKSNIKSLQLDRICRKCQISLCSKHHKRVTNAHFERQIQCFQKYQPLIMCWSH